MSEEHIGVGGGGGSVSATKNVLLIIDPQIDFIPGKPKGNDVTYDSLDGYIPALPVGGAYEDMLRLIDFIRTNVSKINEIHVTLDSHTVDHIGHQDYWVEVNTDGTLNGKKPEFFTEFRIDGDRIKGNNEKFYEPAEVALKEWTREYIQRNNGHPTLIWPTHCIKGETGWQIFPQLWTALIAWRGQGRTLYIHEKGENRKSEMYSAFSADVKVDNVEPPNVAPYHSDVLTANAAPNLSTKLNTKLIEAITTNVNKLFVAGEAKNFCVADSSKDLLSNSSNVKIYLLKDATSPIVVYPDTVENIFKKYVTDHRLEYEPIITTTTVLDESQKGGKKSRKTKKSKKTKKSRKSRKNKKSRKYK